MNSPDSPFLPHGGYRKLRSYKVAEAVYDATVVFCDRFVEKRSRTHDQMVQAARSGKQNIVEGSKASVTSKEMEIKLTNVARASLEELRLDVAHLARYSTRPGTVAARRMGDDVPEEEKMRRFRLLENLQEQLVAEINQRYIGETVQVLFEEKVKERWKGRTATNKLVFVESDADLRGKILPVTVTWTGPWSMQARVENAP